MRNIAPYAPGTLNNVRAAIAQLKAAIEHLDKASCPKAVAAARWALASAQGAERHAQRRRQAVQANVVNGGVR